MSRPLSGEVCCLCGKPFAKDEGADPAFKKTREHVPPKQFFPPPTRLNKNLWCALTHESCNKFFREDEEYFYHVMWPIVQENNRAFGEILKDDFRRRASKPQTPAMLRRILKNFSSTSPAGILLPPPYLWLNVQLNRIHAVAIKIARCLSWLHYRRYLDVDTCVDIRVFMSPDDVIDMYRWPANCVEPKSISPSVFSYQYLKYKDYALFAMLFWQAFMFGLAFQMGDAKGTQRCASQ